MRFSTFNLEGYRDLKTVPYYVNITVSLEIGVKIMSKRYKGRKKGAPIQYIIGIVILAAAAVIAIKGSIDHSKNPLNTPSASPAHTASAAVTPSASVPASNITPSAPPKETPPPTSQPQQTSDQLQVNKASISDYITVSKSEDDMYKGALILVNRSYPYQFKDFQELVSLLDNKSSSYKAAYNDTYIGSLTVDPLNKMLDDFYKNTGNKGVYIISGFRSYERQQVLFKNEAAQKGETEASYWVAKPGTSEHHTGLAIDFGLFDSAGAYYDYDGSGDYAWINKNCQKYGFVVRFNESKKNLTNVYYEPWHFRYLGIPHATELTKLGLCLEEYIDYLRSYSYDNPLSIKTDDGGEYNTYFCKGLEVRVPPSGDYSISGNNVDGFIVTVRTA